MIIEKNKIILTDEFATAWYGDDWIEYFSKINSGSIFFDGIEVFPEVIVDGIFDKLELTAVYDDIDFERRYGYPRNK